MSNTLVLSSLASSKLLPPLNELLQKLSVSHSVSAADAKSAFSNGPLANSAADLIDSLADGADLDKTQVFSLFFKLLPAGVTEEQMEALLTKLSAQDVADLLRGSN